MKPKTLFVVSIATMIVAAIAMIHYIITVPSSPTIAQTLPIPNTRPASDPFITPGTLPTYEQ